MRKIPDSVWLILAIALVFLWQLYLELTEDPERFWLM